MEHARYVEALGLNRGQLTTLFYLQREREATPAAIGEWLHQSSSTTTYVVDQLEAQGFVVRRRHPRDRRKLFVCITEAGSQVTDRFVDTIARAVKQVDPNVADTTAQVLRQLTMEMAGLRVRRT